MKNNFYTPLDWWIEYSVWLMLQYKFMLPAMMIARNDETEQFMKQFTLNGIKIPTICKP
jgi:hypothetical protein